MIIKLFSWGCLARGAQLVHIWPCLKPYYCQTTSVNNPNISGMLITLPNIEKMTLSTLWLSKVKVHRLPKLTDSSSCYKFANLATVLFLDSFRSYLEELLLIQLSLTLKNFIAKYQQVCEISRAKLGTKWKKLEERDTFVASVTHDHSENLHWKNFHMFIMIWHVYHTKFMNGSQCFHRTKIWRSLCKNYKFCVIQRS